MPAPTEPSLPPSTPAAYVPTPRQRVTVYLACALLIVVSIVLLTVPSAKVPLGGRIALASVNLIAAAILLLIVRQKSAPPK